MPSWGEILQELNESAAANEGRPDWDSVRRKYLTALHDLSGRNVIIYYTDWVGGGGGGATSIVLEDMQAMMEVCRDLEGPSLDIVLHSPGGSPEATDSIVRYLRQKFTDLRVIVPIAAMSAATMWALAADRIVMGKHSQLGPIDPQLVMPNGAVPAGAIIRQFDRAAKEITENPARLAPWVPILQQYGPALLEQCEAAERMSRRLVSEWLEAGMLSTAADPKAAAERVATFFADYEAHDSHSIGISREIARAQGLTIDDLEEDQDFQDAVLSVHHATMHTFGGAAAKIVENHLGRAYVKMGQVLQMPISFGPQGLQLPGLPALPQA